MNYHRHAATQKQLDYIQGLAGRLRHVLDESDEVLAAMDDVSKETMSKKDASVLIDTLIRTLERVGTQRAQVHEAQETYAELPEMSMEDYERRTSYQAALAARQAYNDREAELFDGQASRPEPDTGKMISVWKRFPNRHKRCGYDHEITYGWAWMCRHPKHRWPVRGTSRLGYATTMRNAEAHWRKHHAGE